MEEEHWDAVEALYNGQHWFSEKLSIRYKEVRIRYYLDLQSEVNMVLVVVLQLLKVEL